MSATLELPLPRLSKGRFASFAAYTDEMLFEACGVRIAFTERSGGVSEGAFSSLNLGGMVDDDPAAFISNRRSVCEAFGVEDRSCIIPCQVHGDQILLIEERRDLQESECNEAISPDSSIEGYRVQAQEGVDAVLVEARGVATMLGFADCMPVIVVSPSGRFAVIHAGWRGVHNEITVKAIKQLCERDALSCQEDYETAESRIGAYNVYIGPYIHGECFETGSDVHDRFTRSFGEACAYDHRRIDLGEALRVSITRVGISPERIADVDACTVCDNDRFFSYRAQGGVCGRHGAFAVRM